LDTIGHTAHVIAALLLGGGLGALVAAQLGPVSLLLARTVLRGSAVAGLALGCAVAVVDASYAGLGLAGLAPIARIGPVRLALGIGGAAVLAVMGVRTLWSAWRIRLGAETADEVVRPARAFRTGLIATASNPLTIASWAAVFAAATAGSAAASATTTPAGAVALVLGVGAGSALWYLALTCGLVAVRRGASATVRTDRLLALVDGLCGSGLVICGGVLAWRSVQR
jgi:putative LysE/RhtB family amino acid efflux pump